MIFERLDMKKPPERLPHSLKAKDRTAVAGVGTHLAL